MPDDDLEVPFNDNLPVSNGQLAFKVALLAREVNRSYTELAKQVEDTKKHVDAGREETNRQIVELRESIQGRDGTNVGQTRQDGEIKQLRTDVDRLDKRFWGILLACCSFALVTLIEIILYVVHLHG